MNLISEAPLAEILTARQRLQGIALRTPLVRLATDGPPPGGPSSASESFAGAPSAGEPSATAPFSGDSFAAEPFVHASQAEIYLKLENLQPVGSFKLRGAFNALEEIRHRPDFCAGDGVWTASAGNMGYALSWAARRLGIPCTVVVPHDAPPAKLEAIQRQGASLISVPFAEYQEIQRQGRGITGHLVHPFADPAVIAGNGTIALEILEDLPDVDAVLVPFGGGGLSCGIACALRLLRPQSRVFACEADSAAPLAASLAAGQPVEISYKPSFISGMGAPFVFPQMWPLASRVLSGSLVVSPGQVASAMRFLAERKRIITEGAGAVAPAAALAGLAGAGKIVCIVSGGNIDLNKFILTLQGHVPD